MKLGEALRELKRLQNKLVRKINLRESTFYITKDKPSVISYEEITEEIARLTIEIRILKLNIEFTNNTQFIEVNGKSMSIAEIIIRMGDLKSELKQNGSLLKIRRFSFEKEDESKVPQKNELEMHQIVEKLEKEKEDLDRILQKSNWIWELKQQKDNY